VMIFDTWGGVLTQPAYQEFSLTYMQKIVAQLKREMNGQRIPVILFSKGIGDMVIKIAETGCDAIGLDWTQDIKHVRSKVGETVALQGNLDPAVLYASPEVIKKEVSNILESFGRGNGHVFNLGHGIHPEIDPEHVNVLINAVHDLSKPFHN